MSQYAIEFDDESNQYHVVAWEQGTLGRYGNTLAKFYTYTEAAKYLIDTGLIDVETNSYKV
jgi:hypothetical protein